MTISDAVEDVTVDSAPPKMDALVDAGSPCRSQLTAKGISYKVTAARGVVDAVNLLGPVNGVLFASGTETKPIGDPMACELALTLVKFADLLKAKGFVRVGGLGSNCYRCCCAWSTTNFCRDIERPRALVRRRWLLQPLVGPRARCPLSL